MDKQIQRRRWLGWRVLIAALLTPTVLLATSVEANADPTFKSAWVGVTWTLPGTQVGPVQVVGDVQCQIGVRTMPGGHMESTQGHCLGGADFSPGWSQVGEAGGTYLMWAKGDSCPEGYTQGGTLGNHERNGTVTTAGTIAAHNNWPIAADCQPTQLCIRVTESGAPGNEGYREECVDVDFTPAEQADTCEYGNPLYTTVYDTPSLSSSIDRHITVTFVEALGDGRTITTQVSALGLYAVTQTESNTSDPDYPYATGYGTSTANGATRTEWTSLSTVHGWTLYQPNPSPAVTGVQIVSFANSTKFGAAAGPQGNIGITDPATCRFWFGPKIRPDDPDSTLDDPFGQVGSENPAGPGDEEPPVIEAPPDPIGTPVDEPTFWGWILELLRQVLGAVLGIPAAILGGLASLFIPDPGAWGADALVDQLKAKPPFSLLGPMGDTATSFGQAFQGTGSCGVLADFGDAEVSCAKIQAVPGMSQFYGLVQFGLISLTGLACFRMTASLFQDGQ